MDAQELTLDQLADETEELLEGYDERANFFDGPPPVDDGEYLVKLELATQQAILRKTDKNGRPYYQIGLIATVSNPGGKFDGRKLFDRPNTIILRGSNRVSGILQALGIKPLPSASSQGTQLAKALQGTPECLVRTQWESRYKASDGTYKTFAKGQKKHPTSESGAHLHSNIGPDGEEITAQATIVAYKKVKK